MIPTPVAVVLTAVFLATGLVGALALVRGARARSLGPCGDTRATELLHLLMSVAMIAMAWGWTGGPDTVDGAVQVVVFGVFAAVLGALALVPNRREARRARLSHGLAAAAMVWMVAAMPLLMHVDATPGTAAPAPAHGGHAAMSMAPGAPMLDTPTTAGWASATSMAIAAVLAVVGVAWVVRAVQLGSPAHRAWSDAQPLIPAPRPALDREPARVPVAVPATGTAATPPLPVSPTPRAAPAAGNDLPAVRTSAPPGAGPAVLAASCHALMGLGMAVMLTTML